MNPKSKSIFNAKDLSIQSNQNEIFLPNLTNSPKNKRVKLKMKHRYIKKKIRYFPISSTGSLTGKPKMYLTAEENENNGKNKEIYNIEFNDNNNIDNPKYVGKERKENITERRKERVIVNRRKHKKLNYITHSHSVDNYLPINYKLLYGFHQNLENTQIFDGSFINGLKSVKRRNNLKNALEKYKRIKSLGKLNISNYFNSSVSNKYGFNLNSKSKSKSKENLNSYNENNNKKFEEDKKNENKQKNKNEADKTSQLKEKEINRIKIRNIININNLNNNVQIAPNKKKYIKINSSLKNISSILNNKIKNIKKHIIQSTKISSSNNLINSPKVLVRQILREEKYIIDENGKEQILDVSQSFLPKKINIKNLEKMNDLNIGETNNNIDDEIMKKGQYKDNDNYNNNILSQKKLINENEKKNLMTISSISSLSSKTNQSINSNILDTLRKKQKPLIIKKSQNKLEKINNVNKLDEIKDLNLSKAYTCSNKEKNYRVINRNPPKNNHIFHEISSFSGRKENYNINSYKNRYYNNKKLVINNCSRQINSINNKIYLKGKGINGIVSPYRVKTEINKKIFNNQNNNYNTERHRNNYSIREIIDVKNDKKNQNNCNIEYNISNTIYIDTSPNKYNNYNNCYTFNRRNQNKTHYIEYKNDFINKNQPCISDN